MPHPDADSFEAFVAHAQAIVEDDAALHADDRWWILSPLLVRQRGSLEIEVVELSELRGTAEDAWRSGRLEDLPATLDAARVAVALHVDLALDDEIFAAIVLAVVGRVARACQYAPIERTDLGTPRLAPWRPGPGMEEEVARALRRLATRGGDLPEPG